MKTRNIPARALLLAGSLTMVTLLAPMAQAQSCKQLQQEITALTATVTALQTKVNAQAAQITTMQAQANSINALKNFFTVSGQDLYFTGNFHIINGSGNGYTANGLGNLFMGYSNDGSVGGSHNIIAGTLNTVNGCNSIVTGQQNTSQGNDETMLGGQTNFVYGQNGFAIGSKHCTVVPNWGGALGGETNTVSDFGIYGIAIGGVYNVIESSEDVIIDGVHNTAAGASENVILGGNHNLIDGPVTEGVICSGATNHLSGNDGFMGGGANNTVLAPWATTLGGFNNSVGALAYEAAITAGMNESIGTEGWLQAASQSVSP